MKNSVLVCIMIILGILHAFKISYELGNIKQCYLPWANVRILFSTLSLKTPSGMTGKPYLTQKSSIWKWREPALNKGCSLKYLISGEGSGPKALPAAA